ncbi:MAG TPA: hypothetical protein VGP93_15085, partial [Polyangiaceae bacterium]|nr:hypothetical protein [Polyangiaceae bacterium]
MTSGGSAGTSGSAGSSSATAGSAGEFGGTAGSGGSSGDGNTTGGSSFVPPTCDGDTSAALPDNAPELTPGVWKNIDAVDNYYANGVVFDVCNPAILYTAGGVYPNGFSPGMGGVFRSTDAGSTWEKLVELDSPARARIDPNDPLHLYVVDGVNGSTMGFWRTRDGGKTWEIPDGFKTVASSPEINLFDAYDDSADPADFNHVLVTFHNPWAAFNGASGVLESFDGGDNWVVHEPEPEWAGAYGYDVFFLYQPELEIGDSQTWLFGTQGNGYWRTTDSGTSW